MARPEVQERGFREIYSVPDLKDNADPPIRSCYNSRSASVQPLVTHAPMAEDSYMGYRIPKTMANV